jgi:hypothetical protein
MACDDVGQTQLTEDRLTLGNIIARNWRQLVPVNQIPRYHIT